MKYYNKFLAVFLILVIVLLTVNAAVEYKRITNLRVKGWLFGDKDKWVGYRTKAATGTSDTFYVAGADTMDYMFVSARTDSILIPLTARIWKKDSCLIYCPQALTHDQDYINWMIIKK